MRNAIIFAIVLFVFPYTCHAYDLTQFGFSRELSEIIINGCKNAKDPHHCTRTAVFIAGNESTAGKCAYKNNIWGMKNGESKTKQEAFEKFLKTYNKYWYTAKGVGDFYSNKAGVLPRTRYCTDEYEKDGRHLYYCPQGFANASRYLSLFNKIYGKPMKGDNTSHDESKALYLSGSNSNHSLSSHNVPFKGGHPRPTDSRPKQPIHRRAVEHKANTSTGSKKSGNGQTKQPEQTKDYQRDESPHIMTWQFGYDNFEWKGQYIK